MTIIFPREMTARDTDCSTLYKVVLSTSLTRNGTMSDTFEMSYCYNVQIKNDASYCCVTSMLYFNLTEASRSKR